MKILFVVPYVPSLVRTRSYNMIRYLRRAGHDVTLGTLYSSDAEFQEIISLQKDGLRIIAEEMPLWRSLLNVSTAVPSRIPLQAVYSYNPNLTTKLIELLTTEFPQFDVVHVEHLRGSKYGLAIRDALIAKPIPVIWDSVDSISYLFKLTSVHSKRWINRAITRFEIDRTARMENWLVDQFQRIVVTSPVDRQAFLDLRSKRDGQERIQVISHGVDQDYFTPGPFSDRAPATLVITGKMSYHANITMTLALAEQIMPRIWLQRPDVCLKVVGKDPPAQIQALARDPRIEVTGTVPDIRPYLRQATLAIAPVQYSAGIQNKLLEAMACATPVVSTTQCTSALFVEPGIDIVLADRPEDFANAVVALLADGERRERIGQAGLAYVRRYHDWAGIVDRLVEIYSQAIINP